MQRVKSVSWGLIWLGVLLGLSLTVQAAKASPSNEIGFSVAAQLPKNQRHAKNSFFDLKMTAGKTQTLKTVIYNVTNRDIKVKTAIHTAYTNSNGVIEYVTPAKAFDPSLTYQMAALTKLNGPVTVTVPAKGKRVVTAQVTTPKSAFSGVILGGWYFKRVDQKVTGQVRGSLNISNQYSYVIGLKYTFGREPAPKLQLGTVKAGMRNYHRGIFPQLRNTTAVIVPKLKLATTITRKSDGKVVQTAKKDNVQLAPNSVFEYPMLTGKTKLATGRYHLHLVAKNSGHRWVFDRDFTISQAAAAKYNRQSVDNSGVNVIWFVVIGALGMLVLMLLGLWLFFWLKRRRQR